MKLLKVDTVDEVKDKLDHYFSQVHDRTEIVSLRNAAGRYIAEEVTSDIDMPQFRRSVVDGYAVVAKDTFGVSDSVPVFLNIAGEVEMGKACDIQLKSGQAVYVPTGGILPSGSDSVVMIEYTEKLDDKTIAIYKPAAPNAKIMNQGDDFKTGDRLYKKGHRISIKDIGMLAAVGKSELKVYKKPIISIISTGDEIIDISFTPELGQIRDINFYALAAFAEETGAIVNSIDIVKDNYDDLKTAVLKALETSDVVLLSGGSSAGNKDMTAEIIDLMGNPGVITHGIAMKPGKPTIIGVIERQNKLHYEEQGNRFALVAGLPGHPMAAIITFDVIINYFIKKYFFHNEEEQLSLIARISENIHAGEGRETYQLVTIKKEIGWVAEPIYAKSGSISQLMLADGYFKMPALSEGVKVNEEVEVILFNR